MDDFINEIDDIFRLELRKIEEKKDDIIEIIVNSISNEIIDLYNEKQKTYQEILNNKYQQKEDKLIQEYTEKIKIIKEL